MSDPEPNLKAYVEEAQQLAAATYECPVCQTEDGIMYADGSWKLGGKKGNQNTRILQYKCSRCGATLRRAIKGKTDVKPSPTETQDAQLRQESPQAH